MIIFSYYQVFPFWHYRSHVVVPFGLIGQVIRRLHYRNHHLFNFRYCLNHLKHQDPPHHQLYLNFRQFHYYFILIHLHYLQLSHLLDQSLSRLRSQRRLTLTTSLQSLTLIIQPPLVTLYFVWKRFLRFLVRFVHS